MDSMRWIGCLVLMAGVELAAGAWTGAAALPVAAATAVGQPPAPTRQRGEAYARLMRATLLARHGDLAAAAAEARRAVEVQPDAPDLLVEAAELLLAVGRREEAEPLARRALERDPQHLDALRFLAERTLERALGAPRDAAALAEATRLFEELERRDPHPDAELLQTLARLRLEAKDLAGAIRATERLVQERPGDATALRTLAQLLLRDGRQVEALRVMLRYVVRHPGESDMLGFVEQLARGQEAWPAVQEELGAAQLPAEAVGLLRLLGEAQLRLGRAPEAVATLEQALAHDPRSRPTRFLLARAWRSQRRFSSAAELFQELVRDFPDNPEAWLELAYTREDQHDLDGALAAYATTLEQLAGNERALDARDHVRRRMATVQVERGRPDEAAVLLAGMERADDPEALELRFRLALQQGDLEAARTTARKLRGADHEGLASLLDGELAVREKRWTRAAERFSEATAVLGAPARRRVAAIYLDAGRRDLATAVLSEWVVLAPEDAEAHYHLADLLHQAELFEDAERELRATLRLDPQHGPALNYLGYSLAERNVRLDEALELVERALKVNAWDGAYLDSLGWVYYQMGRYDAARDPLERAARELPNDPTVLEHLGDVYLRLGEREQALQRWKAALAGEPEAPDDLKRKIAREESQLSEAAQKVIPEAPQPPRPR